MSDTANEQANANGRAFAWHECRVANKDKAVKFYTEVVGWTTMTMPMGEMGDYHMFCSQGVPVCGIMENVGDMADVPPHWSTYIRVPDVDQAVAKAKELGGKLMVGPMDVPTVGRMALLQDDQGAVFWAFTSETA